MLIPGLCKQGQEMMDFLEWEKNEFMRIFPIQNFITTLNVGFYNFIHFLFTKKCIYSINKIAYLLCATTRTHNHMASKYSRNTDTTTKNKTTGVYIFFVHSFVLRKYSTEQLQSKYCLLK